MKRITWKGCVAGAMAAVLSAAMAVSAYGRVFPDTQGHWAQSYVDKWSNAGVVVGYPDGYFRPDANIKKAEFASVLNQIFKYTATVPNTFADVPANAWYASIIQRVVAAGVTSPDAGGRLNPESYLTRGELITMIAKAYKIAPVAGNTTFLDDASISADLKAYVKALQDKGMLAGYAVTGGYEIRTANLLTRAEMLTVLDKASSGSATPSEDAAVPVAPASVSGRGSSGGSGNVQETPTPAPEPVTVGVSEGRTAGPQAAVDENGVSYKYQVSVEGFITGPLNFTFGFVKVTNESGEIIEPASVTVKAGAAPIAAQKQADSTYRIFTDGIVQPENITVEAVIN
jgi:hypothetical protein